MVCCSAAEGVDLFVHYSTQVVTPCVPMRVVLHIF
jgi:hypothetical protein